MIPLSGLDGRAEKHEAISGDFPAHGLEERFGLGQVLCEHGRNNPLVSLCRGGIGAQRVFGRESDSA
jgi:hypothetical protein